VKVRPAAVAGLFYPESARELAETVDALLNEARATAGPPPSVPPRALIAPHAGYVYSGPIAARAFATLAPDTPYRRVAIVGPAHRVHVRGLAFPSVDAFATPLGDVPLTSDRDAITALPGVVVDDVAHADEHCIEVHLPFLQRVLGSFTIVPLLVGRAETRTVAAVLNALAADAGTLLLISSDLSHYENYTSAARHDIETISAILDGREDAIGPNDACGAFAIRGLMTAARKLELMPELLDLRSSGDTAGALDRVVGYGALSYAPQS